MEVVRTLESALVTALLELELELDSEWRMAMVLVSSSLSTLVSGSE